MLTIAGCDCGKDTLYVCVVDAKPRNLKDFARSYKPLILKADREGIETLLALPVRAYAIEPTGDYSRIWVEHLKRNNREILIVSPRRVRHFAEYHDLTNKADNPDAAAIAVFTWENYGDPNAFLKSERLRIKELYLQINSTTRAKNPIQNRLGQRLTFEFPEAVKTYEESGRNWLDPDPPNLWRWLAGEEVWAGWKKQGQLNKSIGLGLSELTRDLARQLCHAERQEYQLELLMQEELEREDFLPYHEVFDLFDIPKRIRACLLSRIYPFEREFLENGRPLKEYVRGMQSKRRSGMTKRDRSEGEFKLCLGMGKVLRQSGGEWKWRKGGSKYARVGLWLYVKHVIVLGKGRGFDKELKTLERQHRQENVLPWTNEDLIGAIADQRDLKPHVAALMIHYQMQPTKGNQRVQATAGRFVRMLYKELVKKFGLSNDN